MSRYNTSTNHPLIPNAQQYMLEQKYVSIHSEDRDVIKYPNSSEFEIELPQDYCNVQGVKLSSWSVPCNYNTFSSSQFNLSMSFRFLEVFLPASSTELQQAIYNGLIANLTNSYNVIISEGFYDQFFMASELTNRFNESVNNYLLSYLNEINRPDLVNEFISQGGYTNFVITYNIVKSNLWFGNTNSKFVIPNIENNIFLRNASLGKFQYPVYSNWGLGAYLGFEKNIPAESIESFFDERINQYVYPRFYYKDATRDNAGYWATNGQAYGSTPVFYLEAPYKLNIMGNSHIYMEVDLLNTIDEYVPFESNSFTRHTNESNGIVNSAFAKIPINGTPLSQSFENDSESFKIFNPPAERISKLKFRFRYHNGLLVDFGKVNYTFILEFVIYRPQNQKNVHMFVPETIAYGPIR